MTGSRQPDPTATLNLRIAHLYPDLLNLYGDRGNILTLMRRCAWRGIGCAVVPISIGDRLDPADCDLVFIGGGQDHEQNLLYADLHARREALARAAEDGLVFLCVCGGYQLMGHYFEDQNGRRTEGLGILDLHTVGRPPRLIGDSVCEGGLLADQGLDPLLVGFENHSGRTYLGPHAAPLARVVRGGGNNGEDGGEGAVWRNVCGTYLHGSFLPKNPAIADYLIRTALSRRYGEAILLDPLDDTPAERVRRQLAGTET